MTNVKVDITMSLDGFIAGPNDRPGEGLGEGGERLHAWLHDLDSFHELHGREGGEASPDSDVLREAMESVGAVVLGRRMFDNAEGWGDNPPFAMPVYVLTHEQREPLEKEGGTTFHFVNDGIESAVRQARAAAGDKDVHVGGGADTIQQALRAGLVDEIHVHVAPMLLGRGVSLFGEGLVGVDLEPTRVLHSPAVTHLRYRVVA